MVNSIISWWSFANVALHLPLTVSRIAYIVTVCMLFECVSIANSTNVDNSNPSKDKYGARERLAKVDFYSRRTADCT